MSVKRVSDSLLFNVPNSNSAVFCPSRQQLAIGREADGANVQVTIFVCHRLVLQFAHLPTVSHIENLSASVATRRDVLSISRKANTADDGFMHKVVEQVN